MLIKLRKQLKNFTFILIYKFYEHFIYDTLYNYTVVIKQLFYDT